MDGGNMTRYRG